MILRNSSKNTVIATNLKEAKSLSDKLFGLLKKTNPRNMLFKTRFGIHTFFLKTPIDIVILDSQNKVKHAKTLKPNSIFIYNPKYLKIIELSQGTIKKSKTTVNDTLEIF